jgi:hypothetical protein
MIKMSKQLLQFLTAMLMTTTVITSVCALPLAEVEEQYVTEDSNGDCQIVYEQASTYTIVLPKKIILGTDKMAEYNVSVNGDIASDQRLSIIPDSTTIMSDVSGGTKADVEATIVQDKEVWTWQDVDASMISVGTVSAEDLSAGAWAGTFKFNIALETLEPQG